jgi:hypothetical protein
MGTSGHPQSAASWAQETRLGTERRHPSSRHELLRRIAAEYEEMPGMILTARQAQRIFGLREDVCGRVLNILVDRGVLRRTPQGEYRSAPRR